MSNINVNNLTPLLGSGSSVSVSGSLVVKNDVTIGGHLYIGDQDTDSVTFSAEVSSSVVPDANITYDLGSSAKRWKDIYLNSLVTHHITASGNISASGTGINGTGSFHHATVNGNVTSSGTASFEGGFFSTNGTGSLAYVTISGDMDIAGHISGSRISASAGLEVDHTGSFRYISSSGDLTASGTGSFGGGIDSSTATGSFGYVQSEGDVTSSGTGSFMDLFVDDNAEIQGFVSVSGDLGVTGDVSSSGRISASAGFETDAGTTSNFGTISSSGNLIISGHVSASRVSASHGFEADTASTSSFGHISASGNAIFGNSTVVISGSAGEITSSGNISSSNKIIATQYFVGSGGALAALDGDGGSNSIRFGNANSVSKIHGLSIDVTGSISMSGALSMSGANASISTDQGSIYAGAAISSSEHLIGNLIQQHTNGVTNFAVDALGQATASMIKTVQTSKHSLFERDGAGALPTIDNDTIAIFQRNLPGASSAAVSVIGHAAGESIVKLGDTDDEDIGRIRYQHTDNSMDFFTNNTQAVTIDSSGHVHAIGNLSSSQDIIGARFSLQIAGVQHFEVDSIGNVSGSGTGSFNSLNIDDEGVDKFNVDTNGHVSASGNISSSAALFGRSATFASNGVNVATIDASGLISASAAMAATSIEFATNGTPVASINTTGTGSFDGGVHAGKLNTITSSFGYISASADISTSGDLYGEKIVAGAGNSVINGNLKINGGLLRPTRVITGNVDLDPSAFLTDAGKILVLNVASGCTVTLPAAAGTGAQYHFFVGTAISSNSYIIKVADATDTIKGIVNMVDVDNSDALTAVTAKDTDDTITLNGGTTSGGALGETLTLTDIATNVYVVEGNLIVPAGSNPADPFSATVS